MTLTFSKMQGFAGLALVVGSMLATGPQAHARIDWQSVQEQFVANPVRIRSLNSMKNFIQRPYDVAVLDGSDASAAELIQALSAHSSDTRVIQIPYIFPVYKRYLTDVAVHDDPGAGLNIIVLHVGPETDWISVDWLRAEADDFNRRFARQGMQMKILLVISKPTRVDERALDYKTRLQVIRLEDSCPKYLLPTSIFGSSKAAHPNTPRHGA